MLRQERIWISLYDLDMIKMPGSDFTGINWKNPNVNKIFDVLTKQFDQMDQKMAALQMENKEMRIENKQLRDENEELKKVIEKLQKTKEQKITQP